MVKSVPRRTVSVIERFNTNQSLNFETEPNAAKKTSADFCEGVVDLLYQLSSNSASK